jgi:hypothetical protein
MDKIIHVDLAVDIMKFLFKPEIHSKLGFHYLLLMLPVS